MTDLQRQIADYLSDELFVDVDELDVDTPLFSSGLVDSFGMVELLLHVEGLAGRKVEPADVQLENLDSIARIAFFVDELRKG